jgi:hypothetical protein
MRLWYVTTVAASQSLSSLNWRWVTAVEGHQAIEIAEAALKATTSGFTLQSTAICGDDFADAEAQMLPANTEAKAPA